MKYDPFVFSPLNHKGLSVFWKNIPTSPPVVHFRILINVGARHDPKEHYGLAHFFEHMPFDGCEDYPTHEAVDQFNRTVLLESMNAFTSMDETVFLGRCKKEDAIKTATFFSKLVFKPLLKPSEIQREKSVITQEIWGRYENARELELYKERKKILYKNHVLENMGTAGGFPDTILGIDQEKLFAFHTKYYHLKNITLFLVGQLDENTVKQIADILVERIPKDGTVNPFPMPHNPLPEIPASEHRISRTEYFKLTPEAAPKQTSVNFSAVIPPESNHAIRDVTGNALENLIHDRIRGALGATYDASMSRHTYGDHIRAIIHTQVDPKQTEEAIKIIKTSLEDVADLKPETHSYIEQARQNLLDRMILSEYSGGRIADIAVEDYVSVGKIVTHEQMINQVASTTKEDVAKWVKDRKDRFIQFIDIP